LFSLSSFFQIPEGALAALEAAAAVFASVVGQAVRADAVAAFVANIPFVGLGKLFPAALTGYPGHNCL
jgi:hypothetical protein